LFEDEKRKNKKFPRVHWVVVNLDEQKGRQLRDRCWCQWFQVKFFVFWARELYMLIGFIKKLRLTEILLIVSHFWGIIIYVKNQEVGDPFS
jgi:hypothetical protein